MSGADWAEARIAPRSGAGREEAALTPIVFATTCLRSNSGFRRGLPKTFVVVDCPAERVAVLARCTRLAPCVLITDEDVLSNLSLADFGALIAQNRPVQILAISNGGDARKGDLLKMGCVGFLEEDAPAAVVRRAIRAIERGEMWVNRRLLGSVFRELVGALRMPRLTPREREILAMIESGLSNREIAQRLSITHDTVRWHIRAVHSKLKVFR